MTEADEYGPGGMYADGPNTEPARIAPDAIETFTGRIVRPFALHATDVSGDDICHALGNICRFAGHSRIFYPVALHSVLVSNFVPERLVPAALLHDAQEAYLCDPALAAEGRQARRAVRAGRERRGRGDRAGVRHRLGRLLRAGAPRRRRCDGRGRGLAPAAAARVERRRGRAHADRRGTGADATRDHPAPCRGVAAELAEGAGTMGVMSHEEALRISTQLAEMGLSRTVGVGVHDDHAPRVQASVNLSLFGAVDLESLVYDLADASLRISWSSLGRTVCVTGRVEPA